MFAKCLIELKSGRSSSLKARRPRYESSPSAKSAIMARYLQRTESLALFAVAPHAGAWIETASHKPLPFRGRVAPHAGAWIETNLDASFEPVTFNVAPHAGAWIETGSQTGDSPTGIVAPHAGAWIETATARAAVAAASRRPPCGGVD